AAYTGNSSDPDLAFDIERKSPSAKRDGRTNGERLAKALGINIKAFDFVEGERDGFWSRAKEVQQELWPATGEYMLKYMLPDKMSNVTRTHLERHFCEFVRAQA